uniref:Ig-like domain-containing protein n=1 Tax=Sphenodon punctatus TaxID=8508 RepID=A0A8D0L3B4_SPHPU
MWLVWAQAVAISIFGAKWTEAGISQSWSLALKRGQTALLECRQTNKHNNMYWYRQALGQGLQFLFYFQYKELRNNGSVSIRFKPDQPDSELFRLNISSVEPEDSAVYFCASSADTAVQSHLLPLQKPP